MYNKRVLIWRFTLVFMKSYAGNWQINCNSRNWRNQMTEQYRTISPEIQGFISDWRSFYRTYPTVFCFHCWLIIKTIVCWRHQNLKKNYIPQIRLRPSPLIQCISVSKFTLIVSTICRTETISIIFSVFNRNLDTGHVFTSRFLTNKGL